MGVAVSDGSAQSALVAGRDYPRSLSEMRRMFPDERTSARHLARLRWGKDFKQFACQRCGVVAQPWPTSRDRVVCSACRAQATVTTGTVLEKTRTPLVTWFEAAWLVATPKTGVSAKTLERTLGVSYRTAWALLHRLRVAMVRAERPRLSGVVEVDETFVGGIRRGMGRGPVGKFCAVVAAEVRDPVGFGRCRLRFVPHERAEYLVPFVCDTVEAGARLVTDGSRAYDELSSRGYQRSAVVAASPAEAHQYLPAVHRVASQLKRWLLGTHQGSIDPSHLQSYLEEFAFRWNRRHARYRGLVFHRLLEQAVRTGPVVEGELTWGYYTPTPGEPLGAGPRRVVLLEGSPVVAALLRSDLAADGRFAVVASHHDPNTTITWARKLEPDLLVLDAAHPPAVADRVARACPGAALVVNDPHRHWGAQQRASRSYPVFDTCYRYGELLEALAGLVEPEKLPF